MPVLSTVGAASLGAFGAFKSFASGGTSSPFIVAVSNGTVYVDPYNPDYKIHQFPNGDYFEVVSHPDGATVEVLVVGAGGGGNRAGGGAGGYVYRSDFPITVGTYGVTVGGSSFDSGYPGNGYQSSFGGLVALGGGAWAQSGGSGGGGNINFPAGYSGLQPTSASGGYGGSGAPYGGFGSEGGGGGAGGDASGSRGGLGRTVEIPSSTGVYETVAAGGYGNRNGVSVAEPTYGVYGNGGWGGGYDDQYGNLVAAGEGSGGLIRIRYKFQ
jgi:hypothetical protein